MGSFQTARALPSGATRQQLDVGVLYSQEGVEPAVLAVSHTMSVAQETDLGVGLRGFPFAPGTSGLGVLLAPMLRIKHQFVGDADSLLAMAASAEGNLRIAFSTEDEVLYSSLHIGYTLSLPVSLHFDTPGLALYAEPCFRLAGGRGDLVNAYATIYYEQVVGIRWARASGWGLSLETSFFGWGMGQGELFEATQRQGAVFIGTSVSFGSKPSSVNWQQMERETR